VLSGLATVLNIWTQSFPPYLFDGSYSQRTEATMMLAAASRAVTTGNRFLLRSFATVGSQIPSVELHS
jgi:hypothetical protein